MVAFPTSQRLSLPMRSRGLKVRSKCHNRFPSLNILSRGQSSATGAFCVARDMDTILEHVRIKVNDFSKLMTQRRARWIFKETFERDDAAQKLLSARKLSTSQKEEWHCCS